MRKIGLDLELLIILCKSCMPFVRSGWRAYIVPFKPTKPYDMGVADFLGLQQGVQKSKSI